MKAIPRGVLSGVSALLLLAQPVWAVDISPTANPIFVDGERVELQSYTIGGYTYYTLWRAGQKPQTFWDRLRHR